MPSLGRLRESIGQAPYESGVIDTISRMIQSGELPSSGLCAVSRKPTDDIIELDLLIPRFFLTQTNQRPNPIAVLALGLFAGILLTLVRSTKIAEEGATPMRVPILVAKRYQAKVRLMGPFRLKRLLRKEAIYAELLTENPHTRITVIDDLLHQPKRA